MSSSQLISYCAKYRKAAEYHRGILVLNISESEGWRRGEVQPPYTTFTDSGSAVLGGAVLRDNILH